MIITFLVRGISLIILTIQLAFGGFNGLTWHSRANCINNESISWDWTAYRYLLTLSEHIENGEYQHTVITDLEYTWRSATLGRGSACRKMGSIWLSHDI